MEDIVGHNCGLVVAHTLSDAHSFIAELQHRGREAAGIAAIGETIDVIKWEGTVNRFDVEALDKIFPSTKYHTYMAHVRYATRGRKDKILEDAHPHVIGGEIERQRHYTIVRDCQMAAVHNGQIEEEYFNGLNKGTLKTQCDTEALLHFFQQNGEEAILRKIPGSYTVAIAEKTRRGVIVLRAPSAIKPGVLGIKNQKHCVASEDIAFRNNRAQVVGDLEPGAVYFLKPNGDYEKRSVVPARPRKCFFEYAYVAGVDSILDGVSVRTVRQSLGEVLAEEYPPNSFHKEGIDVVTFLPRCPKVAAQVYADRHGLPFEDVFLKTNSERAFQGSTADDRRKSIEDNLTLIPAWARRYDIRGKHVLLIDDSMIRGNNIAWARHLLYDIAGVAEAYLLNYTPPIGIIGADGIPRGCSFGVDMPPDPAPGDEFIARGRTREEISIKATMPVYYISTEGRKRAYERVGLLDDQLCTRCIGGDHPLK